MISAEDDRKECRLHLSGLPVDGDVQDNLVVKAYRMLAQDYTLPSVEVYLHKAIPFGAGLGGGSADASCMLRLLRDMFSLPLSDDDLAVYAARLGADCPFFIYNRPMLAEGIGERLSPIDISLRGYFLVLVKPEISGFHSRCLFACNTCRPLFVFARCLVATCCRVERTVGKRFREECFQALSCSVPFETAALR